MTRTARTPKKTFLPATGWSDFRSGTKEVSKRATSTGGHASVSSAVEKRREQRRLRRQRGKQCFHCRLFGHAVVDCPKASEQGVGICFRCGSTEHTSKDCRAKVDASKGDFPFAKCFICDETGHLSKQCPENPRGIYPQGGCCRLCGSVEHKRSDCPDQGFKPKVQEHTISLKRMTDNESADAVDDDAHGHQPPPVKNVKKKPKVVKF